MLLHKETNSHGNERHRYAVTQTSARTHQRKITVQRAATPFEICFWTASLWCRGRALDSVVRGTASNSGVSMCECVPMPHLLIMSARGPRMRSELVDIKYLHIAIHGVLLVWRAHLARQTDIWSDGFWNFWTWRTASETCSCLVTYANILLRETDRENTLHNYKRSSNTGH